MKYVIVQTSDGGRYPFIFPERVVHSDVVPATADLLGSPVTVVSAGFLSLADVHACGNSESLGVESQPMDRLRILLGDSVAYLPDTLVASVGGDLGLADGSNTPRNTPEKPRRRR